MVGSFSNYLLVFVCRPESYDAMLDTIICYQFVEPITLILCTRPRKDLDKILFLGFQFQFYEAKTVVSREFPNTTYWVP